jgi:hypothetical protein
MTKDDSLINVRIADSVFINKFLQADDSILGNLTYLQEMMNGLYITSDDVLTAGGIARISVDAEGSSLQFYYANDSLDSLSQTYIFSRSLTMQFNLFSHNYAGYPIEEYLSDTSRNDSLLFMQSMAGVFPQIRFPGLGKWIDSMPVAINEAKLILPVADTNLTQLKSENFPSSTVLYLVQPDATNSFVYDYVLSPETFGGDYAELSNDYSYTIKVHLQSLARGDIDNLEMIIRPANGNQTVTQQVLYGWSEDFFQRIRLEITYTRL